MKISILIPTKNRLPILRETLHNIYYVNTLPKEDFEVIVSNDGDDDLSVLYDEFPFDNLKIVQNTHKPSIAGNKNNAADYARYEILQFLEEDILIPSDYLQKIINWHSSLYNIILSSKRLHSIKLIEIAKQKPFGRYFIKKELFNSENEVFIKINNQGLFESNWLHASSLSMRREVFEKIGHFNEQIRIGGEEGDFYERAKKLGIKLIYDAKNIQFHNEVDRLELKKWLDRQKLGMYGTIDLCKIHPEGQNHPTWYTNTPLKKSDPKDVKLLKLKKIFCSFPPVYNF
ncbi:MAG: glycosyltransferase, partial [Bacteroidales bacterium]|nr:glycosyltransferase [Bacteroidales bacterium]